VVPVIVCIIAIGALKGDEMNVSGENICIIILLKTVLRVVALVSVTGILDLLQEMNDLLSLLPHRLL